MKIKLFIILAFVPFCFYGQSISPSNLNEYCPLVNLSFTFTAPGLYDNAYVAAVGGNPAIVSYTHSTSSGVSVVTATIQFEDWNRTQIIRFNYVLNGVTTYTDYSFKKIKSQFVGDPSSTPAPNLSSIPAKPCEVTVYPKDYSLLRRKF